MRDGIIRKLAWATLGTALLGVALQTDVSAADALIPKTFWFVTAAGLLATLAVLKLWHGGPLRLPRGLPAAAGGLLVLAQTLAYFASPLQEHAQEAWQAWLLMALLFTAVCDLLDTEAAWLTLLRMLSLTALLAGAWSVAQSLGLDHSAMGLACREAFGPRIAGSLGNPNFAGGFFLLLLPVLLWSALRDPRRWARHLGAAAALMAAAGLALSASKAAFLGVGVELGVAAHLFFWSAAAVPAKRRAMAALGGGTLLALLLVVLLLPAPSRQRLWRGWAPGSESIQFRWLTWGGALQGFKARPLLGWGPGNFSVVYPGFRLPQATAGLAQRSYEVSHAENWVVQTLLESGIVGLLALGFFLVSLLLPLRLVAIGWDQGPLAPGLALALTVALLGSLAGNLASLDCYLASTLLPFCLLAALALRVADMPLFALSLNPEPYARILVSIGLAIFAVVPPLQAQMHWRAERDLLEAKTLSAAGRFDEAIPLYRRALYLHPSRLEARYFLASSLQDRARDQDLHDAETEFAELRLQAPDFVLVHAKLARLYTREGRLAEAAEHWQRQLKLDPYLLQGIQELTSLYAGQGKLAEAREVLQAALVRFPAREDFKRNLASIEAALKKKAKHP